MKRNNDDIINGEELGHKLLQSVKEMKTGKVGGVHIFKQRAKNKADKLKQVEQAVHDSRFIADLHEVMSDFATVDTEWWEKSM